MYNKKLCSHYIIWLLATAMLTVNTANAQKAKPANGIFYAISGNGLKDTSYLFGTYHLMKDGYLNTMPVVKRCFDKAGGVVVEVVIDSAKLPEANQKMFMQDDSLSALVDKAFYDSLDTELTQTLGVGAARLNKFKPAAISATLAMVYVLRNNAPLLNQYTGSPLDVYFVNTAKQTGKNITPLETMDLQMGLLFTKPAISRQLDGLKMFLRNKETMVGLGDSLVKAYVNNDLGEMYNLYNKTLEASHDEDYLIRGRNNEWMKVLPVLISNSPQFIAVGALHLAGPYGLVAQLTKLGYTVTSIKL